MRKQNLILVFILTVFISTGSWATELWNGFTTNMNREQVIARARTVLGTGEFTEHLNSRFRIFDDDGSDQGHQNALFPPIELELRFRSPLVQYRQNRNNVQFFFYNGRLFGIWIFFTASIGDFFPLAVNQYGQPTRIVETSRNPRGDTSTIRWERWATTERVVWTTQQVHQGFLYIYDNQAMVNVVREREEAAERRRAEEAARIQF